MWLVTAITVAAAAGATAAMVVVRTHRPAAAHAAARSPLAPDPAAIRYRHAIAAPDADAETAIAELEARAQGATPSPFDLGELAELYLRRAKLTGDPADYDAAEARAQRSLAILPAPNAAVLALAQLAAARHDFAQAIELARRHQHGRSAGALTQLATAHLALGELVTAAGEADALVAAQPTSASYLMRALVLQAQGRDAEAAFDFARAARVEEPGDPGEAARLRALWARFLIKRGELAGAEAVLDEALRIAPGHPLALAQRGELALRRGRLGDARAQLEQAFAASRQVRYLIDQARAQDRSGDRPGADALRDQVARLVRGELAERGAGHRLELVEVLVARGRPADVAEAVTLAREELATRGSADARFQLARALARAGRTDEAVVQVAAALATGARDALLYELAGALEQQRGNAARAALYARLAAELDPDAGHRRAELGLP